MLPNKPLFLILGNIFPSRFRAFKCGHLFYNFDIHVTYACIVLHVHNKSFFMGLTFSYFFYKLVTCFGQKLYTIFSAFVDMSKRSKKDRSLPPAALPPEMLTPSTVLKVGEAFIVLRRAPNKSGVTDERCLATVVEIREGDQASTSSASTSATVNATTATTLSSVNYLTCLALLDL